MSFKHLTPVIPGLMQPLLCPDGHVREGFASGRATEGQGFPQWAIEISTAGRAHWFLKMTGTSDKRSLCGRVWAPNQALHLPGNFPRCKACESALAAQKRNGVTA